MKCIQCGNKQVHSPNCPSENVMVLGTENIDLMIQDEVQEAIKEYEDNFNKYGTVGSDGHK